MSHPRIPIAGPSISALEIEYVTDAATHGWYDQHASYVNRFEDAVARYVGRQHAVALPSCTSALHLALLSHSIGAGDEVIVPEATWIATAAPITYVGAMPVFADIEQDSWCISVESIRRQLTSRTRALVTVGLYGDLPEMDAIAALADEYGLVLIEDAAQSLGASFRGRPSGSFGGISVLSFHGTKTVTTGEGGMLLTDNAEIVSRVRFLRDHGRSDGPRMFWNTEIGHKYRMSNLQAALGLGQVERVDELIRLKSQIFDWYREELSGVPVTLNRTCSHVKNGYWMVTAAWDRRLRLSKEAMVVELSKRGIGCRPFFYPLSSLPAYAGHPQALVGSHSNPVSYDLSSRAVNLPSALTLTREMVAEVCQTFRSILASSQ